MHTLDCYGCGESFTAKSPHAKWCRPGCRKAAERAAARGEEVEQAEPKARTRRTPTRSKLVLELERELTAADRLDTFDGQFALSLAEQMTASGASGVAGLAKELRAARAAALAGVPKPGEQTETAIERARRMREEKKAAAQAAAG